VVTPSDRPSTGGRLGNWPIRFGQLLAPTVGLEIASRSCLE